MEQFNKIKIQKEELEDVKLFSIDEIENILDREDKHYKLPQKSELAIMIMQENQHLYQDYIIHQNLLL